MAPSVCCVFVGHLEEQMLYQLCCFFPFISEFLQFSNGHFHTLSDLTGALKKSIFLIYMPLFFSSHQTADQNTFLRAQSFHPVPLEKRLPVSQLTKLKRTCDDPEECEKRGKNRCYLLEKEITKKIGLYVQKTKWIQRAKRLICKFKPSKSKLHLIYCATFTPKTKKTSRT